MDNKVPVIITNPNEDNININIGVNNVSITKSLGSISGILFVILSALKENYNEYILYYYDIIYYAIFLSSCVILGIKCLPHIGISQYCHRI